MAFFASSLRISSLSVVLLLAIASHVAHAQDLPPVPDGFDVCNREELVSSTLQPFISSSLNPFCMNGGTCKEDYEDNPEAPCDCPDGVAGPHCEFQNGELPECNLKCYNDGVCMPGLRTWTGTHFAIDSDRWNYCQCQEGFYGAQCEIDGRQCGPTTHCLNGGECVKIFQDDGTATHHCDCTNSRDEKGANFAGRYCQVKADSYCSDHDPVNPTNYCVNGGECRPEAWLGCECKPGFMGTMCEFNEIEPEPYECNMQCAHGFCRKGAKDTSWLTEFEFGDRRLTQRFTQEFEHCQCPPGWVGLNCDFKMNVCPGRTNVCLNGAECVLDEGVTDSLVFDCDCSTAKEDGLRYAGKYCQYKATSYCTFDGHKPKIGSDAFCTNNGVCSDYVNHDDPHPGCVCDENFEGDHCEVLIGSEQPEPGNKDGDFDEDEEDDDFLSSDLIWIAIVVVAFVSILLLICISVLYRRRRMQQQFIESATDHHLKSLGPYLDNENFAPGEKASSPTKEELHLDPIYEAYSSGTSFSESDRRSTSDGGRSASTSRGSASGISRSSVGGTSRGTLGMSQAGRSQSHSSTGGRSLVSMGDGSQSTQSTVVTGSGVFYQGENGLSQGYSDPRYETFRPQEGPIQEFEDAALMPINGEVRLVSGIPVDVRKSNDPNFNPADLAKSDYSLEDSSLAKQQLQLALRDDDTDTGPRGEVKNGKKKKKRGKTMHRSSPDDEMAIQRKSTDNSGMSSEIASMSSMGSSTQNFAKNLQGVDSFGSYANGEVIYLSDEYSLGNEGNLQDGSISSVQDGPIVLSNASQEGSNFVLMSQASELAGTVLNDGEGSTSENSTYVSSEGSDAGRMVQYPGVVADSTENVHSKSKSGHTSQKSSDSISTAGTKSVRFDRSSNQESSRHTQHSLALSDAAIGGDSSRSSRTAQSRGNSKSSASSHSSLFTGPVSTKEPAPIEADSHTSRSTTKKGPSVVIERTGNHSKNNSVASGRTLGTFIGTETEVSTTTREDGTVSTSRSGRSKAKSKASSTSKASSATSVETEEAESIRSMKSNRSQKSSGSARTDAESVHSSKSNHSQKSQARSINSQAGSVSITNGPTMGGQQGSAFSTPEHSLRSTGATTINSIATSLQTVNSGMQIQSVDSDESSSPGSRASARTVQSAKATRTRSSWDCASSESNTSSGGSNSTPSSKSVPSQKSIVSSTSSIQSKVKSVQSKATSVQSNTKSVPSKAKSVQSKTRSLQSKAKTVEADTSSVHSNSKSIQSNRSGKSNRADVSTRSVQSMASVISGDPWQGDSSVVSVGSTITSAPGGWDDPSVTKIDNEAELEDSADRV